MTSTTSCFLPAATRAGTPAYSPETAASLASTDSAETRSFDEMCSGHDSRGDADLAAPSAEPEESAAACTDEAPTSAATEPSDEIVKEVAGDEEEERDESTDPDAVPLLESPSIIQTLLASLRERTSPAPVTATSSDAPAENAAPQATLSTAAVSVRSEGRGSSAANAETAGDHARVAGRQHRQPTAATEGQTAEPRADRRQSANSATPSPRAADAEPTVAAVPGTVVSKGKTSPADDVVPQPAVARLLQAKGHVEKFAGRPEGGLVVQAAPGQNKFLSTDNQQLTASLRAAGTRTAIPAGTMSSSSSTAQRHIESPVLATASSTAAGQGTWAETLSVDWKGWTNGGGERSSTAAQFSQLGDKLNHAGVAATPATAAVARAATPVVQQAAPVAPTVPADAAEALAPIHSAIERLVLHGRDQLALTVRFEQGGSLSIKLGLNQGEIATQIQTDVPGLEAALKSAWGELAQDWNSRGWKLGQPEFTASTATYHQREDTTADSRGQGRQAQQEAAGDPSFGGRAFTPARLKHTGAAVLSGLDALRAAALARRGIHTWA